MIMQVAPINPINTHTIFLPQIAQTRVILSALSGAANPQLSALHATKLALPLSVANPTQIGFQNALQQVFIPTVHANPMGQGSANTNRKSKTKRQSVRAPKSKK